MYRGKQLGESWASLGAGTLKENMQLTLMGSAEEITEEAAEKVVFEEDLNILEKAGLLKAEHPPGLMNLGNTCYLNSALQLLGSIPELRTHAKKYAASTPLQDQPLVKQFGVLCSDFESNLPQLMPMLLWSALKQSYPQFDQKTDEGHPMQHDSEEALSSILYSLDSKLPQLELPADAPPGALEAASFSGTSAIQQLLHGRFETHTTCLEKPEDVSDSEESFLKLKCHIDIKTNFLMDGIQPTLTEQIEKYSPFLDRNALYQTTRTFSRLPKYLIVHFVRFLWRKGEGSKEGARAKILRPVDFPMELDLFPLCSKTLQQKLKYKRDILERHEQSKLGLASKSAAASSTSTALDQPSSSVSSILDPFENDSGMYELTGVVSHKGRTAYGGHYVAWIRDAKDPNL